MKRLLVILLCMPFFFFSQEKKKSKFNFKKTNNYSKNMKNQIKDTSTGSIFDSSKSIKKFNDSTFIKKQDNVLPFPLNKGLIYILSETLKKEKENQKFTIKKKEKIEK